MKKLNQTSELDVAKIVPVEFPVTQYFKVDHPKTQIVLHHSAGWDNARGMFDGWKADKARVATCCGINDSGTIFQIFDPQFWAYHVNIMSNGNNSVKNHPVFQKYCNIGNAVALENRTIGVEVCNWGGLTLIDGKFHAWASKPVINKPGYEKEIVIDEKRVIEYAGSYRGSKYFERYTDPEVESLWKLIRYWCKRFSIPTIMEYDIFDVSEEALRGKPGVWTHTSFRADKQDLHPQPEILEMLAAL